jgi:hypothetical protein
MSSHDLLTVDVVNVTNTMNTDTKKSISFFLFHCGLASFPRSFFILRTPQPVHPKHFQTRFTCHTMVYTFGNPVYDKRSTPGNSSSGQYSFG